MPIAKSFIANVIDKNAKKMNLEGTVQTIVAENRVKVIVCGDKDAVDDFIDAIHKDSKGLLENFQIEPFLKDKDYRGVFRIIE